jgi:hypothetical protein
MPVRPLFGKAQEYQDDGGLGCRSANEVIVVLGLKIVDDFAVLQLPIDGGFCLVVEWEAAVNEAIPPLGNRRELPIDSIVVPVRGVVDTGDASQGVNVSKAKAFFGMLFGDRHPRSPDFPDLNRSGVLRILPEGV